VGNKTGTKGFTLPELLITMVIVGVLAAFAAPSMSAMIKRNRVAVVHNEFLSALYLVRSEAAKRNRVMKMCRLPETGLTVCAGADGGSWHRGWAIWADEDRNDQIDGLEPVVHVHNGFSGDARMTGNASVANRIAFQPSGAISGVSNGTFTVCIPGGATKQQIIVSKPGRLRTTELPSDGTC
jgi:type IV fimbrial biogenesis protein FimT